jgi:4-amino-4-deoxy-L-arabinose transferase-like glycosyltransferase
LFWVATALSAWDKGPLAFIPIAYGFLAPKVIYDDWRRCDRLRPLVGLPLTLAVGLVWPVAVAVINPEHMFHILLDREIAGQFEGSWYSGILSAWKAPGIIFSRYMPWGLLLIPGAIVFPWRRWRTHPLAPSLLYVVVVAIPFIFVVSRRGDRLAPVYPALAVVCAWAAVYALRGQALLRTSVAMLPLAAAGFSIYFLYYSIQAKDPSGRHLMEFVRAVKPVVVGRPLVVCPIDNRLLAFQAFLGMNQQGHNPTEAPPGGGWVVAYETSASPAPKVRSGILPIVGGKRLLLYWADDRTRICREGVARGLSVKDAA